MVSLIDVLFPVGWEARAPRAGAAILLIPDRGATRRLLVAAMSISLRKEVDQSSQRGKMR
jgi:hypothetical protein